MKRGLVACSVCCFDHAGSDANFFRAFRVNTKSCSGLFAEFALSLRRLDNVGGALRLLLGVHVSLEGDKPCTRRRLRSNADVFEGIAILPNVEGGAGSRDTENQEDDHQIDETFLNNPPIKSKRTGSISHY